MLQSRGPALRNSQSLIAERSAKKCLIAESAENRPDISDNANISVLLDVCRFSRFSFFLCGFGLLISASSAVNALILLSVQPEPWPKAFKPRENPTGQRADPIRKGAERTLRLVNLQARPLDRNQLRARFLHQLGFVFAQLGKLYAIDVPRQAEFFERPDSVPIDIDFIPLKAVAC